MYREYPSLEAWASDIRAGRVTLANGQHLSTAQMAALRLTPGPMALDARLGAPGSRSALDAPVAEKALVAASTALQRRSDQEAAAVAGGDPVQRMARKIEAHIAQSPTFQRLEAQRVTHVLSNATLNPMHAVAARLTAQGRATVTADGTIPSAIAQKVLRQFQEVEVSLGPQRDTVTQQLRELREAVDRLAVLVEALSRGDVTMSASVRSHLAAVAQKHATRRLMGVA